MKCTKWSKWSATRTYWIKFWCLVYIREGASIGVREGSAVPSDSINASTAFEHGDQISNTICKLIRDNYVMGTFHEDNLLFEDNRFSEIITRMKGDGTARTILNLNLSCPLSINDGRESQIYNTHE